MCLCYLEVRRSRCTGSLAAVAVATQSIMFAVQFKDEDETECKWYVKI